MDFDTVCPRIVSKHGTEVLQTSSFQFSVGSFQQEKRVLLKTENQKLYTTGLFAKVLLAF
jgi:hypothetical protein